jgi:hypothetical protein
VKYPPRLIARTLCLYNLGCSQQEAAYRIASEHRITVPRRTISHWTAGYRSITTFHRLRDAAVLQFGRRWSESGRSIISRNINLRFMSPNSRSPRTRLLKAFRRRSSAICSASLKISRIICFSNTELLISAERRLIRPATRPQRCDPRSLASRHSHSLESRNRTLPTISRPSVCCWLASNLAAPGNILGNIQSHSPSLSSLCSAGAGANSIDVCVVRILRQTSSVAPQQGQAGRFR